MPRRFLHLRLPGEARRRAGDRCLGLPLRPRLRLPARRVLRLPLTAPPARSHPRPRGLPRQSGMFECLRQGSSIFFAASIASDRQIRRRVSCGWITSSM